MPRHSAREFVVGVDDRGVRGVEAGDHFAFGARDAFDAAEPFEMFGAGIGDEPDGRARELAQASATSPGVIGADLDDRETMRARRGDAA